MSKIEDIEDELSVHNRDWALRKMREGHCVGTSLHGGGGLLGDYIFKIVKDSIWLWHPKQNYWTPLGYSVDSWYQSRSDTYNRYRLAKEP